MKDDLISRQAAIDAIWDGINMDIYTREVKEILEELPTAEKNDEEAFEEGYTKAQMELKDAYKPKKGKWVQDWRDERGYTHISGYKCTECDALYPWRTNYCPDCGARMEERDGL